MPLERIASGLPGDPCHTRILREDTWKAGWTWLDMAGRCLCCILKVFTTCVYARVYITIGSTGIHTAFHLGILVSTCGYVHKSWYPLDQWFPGKLIIFVGLLGSLFWHKPMVSTMFHPSTLPWASGRHAITKAQEIFQIAPPVASNQGTSTTACRLPPSSSRS